MKQLPQLPNVLLLSTSDIGIVVQRGMLVLGRLVLYSFAHLTRFTFLQNESWHL